MALAMRHRGHFVRGRRAERDERARLPSHQPRLSVARINEWSGKDQGAAVIDAGRRGRRLLAQENYG